MIKRCLTSLVATLIVCFLACSSVSARVCFLPDSTDCGEGDVVGSSNVEVPCQYSNCPAHNEAYQECYPERIYNNGGVNVECQQVRCKLSKSECEKQEADANNSQCCNFDSASGCYYMGKCQSLCNRNIYDSTTDLSGEDYTCTSCKDKNGTFYNCTAIEKECKDINPKYTSKCADTQTAEEVEGVKDSKGNQCYTCKDKPVEKNCSDINKDYKNKDQVYQCNIGSAPVFGVSGSDGQCYTCVDDITNKPTITIKTKDKIADCQDDSWEDWKDDNNGTSLSCEQKITSSFSTQASDGNSYNVSLSLNGRNLITDTDDNEITENVSSCHVLNYPLNITANSETNIYTYGTCQIYTDDDSYYYNVEAGANTLSVNIEGVQVLSGLTLPINQEGSEFAILGDFDGKTYDAGNYTIKFVKATDYCKDINKSYIGENSSCLSTQDKISVDGVTTEIDGQCYTCQTKSEYANTATLCCSLGYQEREYMSGFNWYSYTGDGVKEGCVPYRMWQDAVSQYKDNDDYVSEYGYIPNKYPNDFGCPTYGMSGKWHIGWFGTVQSDYGLTACFDVPPEAMEFGHYIEGSLYNISGYVQDGIYKQRLITSMLDAEENHGVVCGGNIQKWLDEHRSNATMCRYNFTTVTQNDDAYYKIHAIGNSGSDMLNHCWYQDADGRDVTDQIEASKRAPAARNKIEPIDESKADDDYQVRTYAEKYNGDLVDACQGYSVNKDKLTPLTIDIKN